MDPLDEFEVKRYLHELNARHVLNALETGATATMGDLLSRPLYVEMLIAAEDRIRSGGALDSLTLNRLYDFYFQYWYMRELQNIGRAPGDLPPNTVRNILSSVAHKMSSTGKPYISEAVLHVIVRDHASIQQIPVANDLFVAARERLILIPEFTSEEPCFSFRHDSLRSYFYSLYLADRINATVLTDEDVMGLDPPTVDFLFAIADTDTAISANMASLSSAKGTASVPTPKDVLAFLWNRKRHSVVDATMLAWLCTGDENIRSMVSRSLTGVTFPTGSLFSELLLNNASFRGSTLDRAAFDGGSLVGSDFRMADLSKARLSAVDLNEAHFDNAIMNGCRLVGIDVTGVHFVETILEAASIADCTYTDATFKKAKMLGVSARGSKFVRVSFNGADLRTSHFDACTFEDCSFAKTLLTGARFEPSCVFVRTDLSEGIIA